MDIVDFLEDNDINDVIKKYFSGNFNYFITFLNKSGLVERFIDDLIEENFYKTMNYYIKDDPQYVIDYITDKYFGDVKLEGNTLWMTMSRENLSNLFYEDSRSEGTRNVAKIILSEDYMEFFHYVDYYDLENDIIDILTPKNLIKLKKAVYKEIEGQEINIDGEEDILTMDTIMNMSDSELSEIIKNHTPDIHLELSNLYNTSYESAYHDELYNLVMDELRSFFGYENFSREIPYKRKKVKKGTTEIIEVTDYMFQVNVSNILPTVIETVLGYGGYESDNDFEYLGSFESVLELYLKEEGFLDFRVPDYADYRLTEENINQLFNDYI